jgi:hypothetical protein
MDGGRPEEHVADPKKMSMEKTSRRQRIMEASCEGGQGPAGPARRRWKEWNGMLKAIVRSYMTGPIEGSSVETQARYWTFKIVLVDFQRPVPPLYVTLNDPTSVYPTQPNDMLFTIFFSSRMHKLKLSRTGKAKKKPRAFKSLTRNGVPVSYKKENNAWIDSEIF